MRIYNRISTRYVVSCLIISLSLSLSLSLARARQLSLSLSIWTGNIQLLQRWVQGVYAWDFRWREQLDDERSATQVEGLWCRVPDLVLWHDAVVRRTRTSADCLHAHKRIHIQCSVSCERCMSVLEICVTVPACASRDVHRSDLCAHDSLLSLALPHPHPRSRSRCRSRSLALPPFPFLSLSLPLLLSLSLSPESNGVG
jgi:hypothetical protein